MSKWIGYLLIVCLGSACALEVDEDSPEVDVVEAAIKNGNVISDAEHSGILALQVYSTTWASWTTVCTATLMTNSKAITAAHCVDPDPYGRQLYAKMGSQRIAVSGKTPHPDWDVAVIKLARPMAMWNWNGNGFLTSPAKITTSGYGRSGYTGTNSSLDGGTMLCFGYGGARANRPQPPLTSAALPTVYRTDRLQPLDELHVYKNNQNQLQEPGDSGGPCLTGLSTIGSPLAYVLSGCFPSLDFCYGAGAEDWALWAYLQLTAP